MSKRLLVTSALPYVNGPIHIGHLVEYIQTDIFVRFQRLQGNEVAYICADDTHGTATMIRARQEKRTEAEIIEEMGKSHIDDFAAFGIKFDHYGSTNSESNHILTNEFWSALRKAGVVEEKVIEQLYDSKEGCFLADRFVKGTCPKCYAPEQYGDSCEKCGATYSPEELLKPTSTLSGVVPELRKANHLFVRLEPYKEFLKNWIATNVVHPSIEKWINNTFLNKELRNWDVSRPAPYFGFEIPDSPGNYFYVWVDAPIGYIASTKDWCEKTGKDCNDWWKDPTTEIHHFIGKDITYFHTLFWPVMANIAGYQLPKQIHVHGFLTVNGAKMAKRTGTFIRARTYLDNLDPSYLRYYYATKVTDTAEDIDFNLTEFVDKINADLVGKVINLASRTAKLVPRLADTYPEDGGAFANGIEVGNKIRDAYNSGNVGLAMRLLMGLTDQANKYVETNAPWLLKKDPTKADELLKVATVSLNLFRQIAIYISPVLPLIGEKTGVLLNAPITSWMDGHVPLVANVIQPFTHMMNRVDPVKIDAMINASKTGVV